jgi:hypothetical protein
VGLVKVAVVPDGVTASIVEGMLKAAGIPAVLRGTASSDWLFPSGPMSLGAVEILVSATDEREARLLLGEVNEPSA